MDCLCRGAELCCRRAGRGLPLPPDHGDRSLRCRRPDRLADAGARRADARLARAAADHRERHRRNGEHRGRPRRAGGARRLHREHRQHRDPRHQRRRVQSQIRRHQRSRTGRAAAAHVVPARCAHQHSGEEARRVRHLGQGERKAAGSGNAGGRLDTPRRWNPVQRAHGRAAVVRAVSRRRRRCRTSSPARST
jgi:hypothetical protein